MITPTLVVGLGGTGMKILSLFKQRIRSLCGKRAPVSFLGIDTDRENLPGAALSPDEFALCECVRAPAVVKNLDDYPTIQRWWNEKVTRAEAIVKGAKMKRPVGRLACFYNYPNEIQWRLESRIKRLQRLQRPSEQVPFEVREGKHLRVYVVGSLSGGTGGGFFFDMAMAIRDEVERNIGEGIKPIIVGVVVLPRGFIPLMPRHHMKQRVQANFYAGLKEIEYLSSHYDEFQFELDGLPRELSHPPFDTIYLLDTLNQAGKNIESTDRLHSMIASEICLEVYSSITENVESALVNMEDDTARLLHGKRCFYGSFATAALVIPGRQILDYCVMEYARERLNASINDAQPEGTTAEDEVNSLLANSGLLLGGEEHLAQSLKDTASGDMTTSAVDTIPSSKATSAGRVAAGEWRKMQDRKRGVEAACKVVESCEASKCESLSAAMRAYFENRLSGKGGACGLQFLIKVSRHLVNRLHALGLEVVKQSGYVGDLAAAKEDAKAAYSRAQKAPKKGLVFWRGSSGRITGYEEFAESANTWSRTVLDSASYEAARRVYDALEEEANKIKQGLKLMADQVERACHTLQVTAAKIKRSVGSTSSKHDYVLVESVLGPQDFHPLYEKLRKAVKAPAIEIVLRPKGGTLDDWSHVYLSDLESLLNDRLLPAIEEAFEPLVGGMDVLSAAEKHAGISVKQWIRSALKQCSPFCNFDEVKVPGGYFHETYVGVPNAKSKRYQNAIGNVTPAKVVSTGNSNEILIHTMMTALPAFAVSGLGRYRQIYEYYCDMAQKNPDLQVHMDRKWVAADALPDLFPDGK